MYDVRAVARRIFDGTIQWTDDFEMGILAWNQFVEARTFILANKAVESPYWAIDGHAIFSDASDNGFGVVVAGPRINFVQCGLWTNEERAWHIGEKEAEALSRALTIATRTALVAPTFVTDASSLFYSCSKGLNKNFKVNRVVAKLKTNFPQSLVLWVCSKDNPADGPSRGLPVTSGIHLTQWAQDEVQNIQKATGMPVYRSTPTCQEEMNSDPTNPFLLL